MYPDGNPYHSQKLVMGSKLNQDPPFDIFFQQDTISSIYVVLLTNRQTGK